MQNHLPAFVKQPRVMDGAIAGTLAGAAMFAGVGMMSFVIPTSPGIGNLSSALHVKAWALLGLDWLGFQTDTATLYKTWLAELAQANLAWQIEARMWLSAITGTAAGLWAGWEIGKPRDFRIKKEGGKLIEGDAIFKYGQPKWFNKNKFGIELLPGFRLQKDKEREHFIVAAGTGGGKSTAIMPMMINAKNRGDRVLIFDFKGITEKWPGKVYKDRGLPYKSSDTVIIAPWDKRSVQWNIAVDINSSQAAKDFAARLIPESQQQVFSQGGRQVLTGCMIKLIKERPRNWSFKDLAELIVLDIESMISIMKEHFPEGLRAVEGAPVTVTGILLNVGTFSGLIFDLAEIWPQPGGFSIINWVKNKNHQTRTVIFKTSSQFETLSSAINGALLGSVCSLITGMPDVNPGVAPLWIWLDEFSTLGKINGWPIMMVTGRSKDFRIIMNLQSRSQLVETWGQNLANTWVDAIGTKLIGRNDGEGAEWAAELIGSATFSYPSYSDNNGKRSVNWSPGTEEPLFSANRVKTDLGKGKFVAHGLCRYELKLQFPDIMSGLPLLRKPDIESSLCTSPHKLETETSQTQVSQTLPEPQPHATDHTEHDLAEDEVQSQPDTLAQAETQPEAQEIDQPSVMELSDLDLLDQLSDQPDQPDQQPDQGQEITDNIAEEALPHILEVALGADIAEIADSALNLTDLDEAIDQPADQDPTNSTSTAGMTKAERLKLRKKQKLEAGLDPEQSL